MKFSKFVQLFIVVLFLSSGTIIHYCGFEDSYYDPTAPIPEEAFNAPATSVFPVHGTLYLDPDIINESDPSVFKDIVYKGQGERFVFDRRIDNWGYTNVFLFHASYQNGSRVEVRVNLEFEPLDTAQTEAAKYAKLIGQLPNALRKELKSVTIHRGNESFGGGNGDILIHTGHSKDLEKRGTLEEALIHEGAHTSLDSFYENSSSWIRAQQADSLFISTYAEEHPGREDVAESFVLYQAVRYRADRITAALSDSIMGRIPNRIAFFDSLELDMYPLTRKIRTRSR